MLSYVFVTNEMRAEVIKECIDTSVTVLRYKCHTGAFYRLLMRSCGDVRTKHATQHLLDKALIISSIFSHETTDVYKATTAAKVCML